MHFRTAVKLLIESVDLAEVQADLGLGTRNPLELETSEAPADWQDALKNLAQERKQKLDELIELLDKSKADQR